MVIFCELFRKVKILNETQKNRNKYCQIKKVFLFMK